MFGQSPSVGSVAVAILGGFAAGLLVAVLIVTGRTSVRPLEPLGVTSIPAPTSMVRPVTVTVTAGPPRPVTVTEHAPVPPARTLTETTVVFQTETVTPVTTAPTTTSAKPTGSPSTTPSGQR